MRAAIDIGTNTVLLLIAEEKEGKLYPVYEEQRIPRLGKGVDADGVINDEATQRVLSALKDYKNLMEAKFPEIKEVVVTATSAVRDASNREDFLQEIKSETGFTVRLLSGNEEADWTAAGALSMLQQQVDDYLILDIGGGSTEVAQITDNQLHDSHSFDMGSVRFTERFLKKDPPDSESINACQLEILRMFEKRPFEVEQKTIAVGVAGTLSTLASMILKLDNYDPSKLNDYILTRSDVEEYVQKFSSDTSQNLLKLSPKILKGREDIFLAGLLILKGFMVFFGFEEITVSTGGIRHGAILKTKNATTK